MMKEMEDIKQEMKTVKKELKAWEHQFESVYGRKPEKADIAAVPDIAKKYKLYAKLKTAGSSNNELNDTEDKTPVEKKPPKPSSPPTTRKQPQTQVEKEHLASPPSVEPSIKKQRPKDAFVESGSGVSSERPSVIQRPNRISVVQESETKPSITSPLSATSPSIPLEPARQGPSFKSTIASGPMATASLGQGADKFRARLKAQQEQQEKNRTQQPAEDIKNTSVTEDAFEHSGLATYKETAIRTRQQLSSQELLQDVDLQDFAERKKKMLQLGEQPPHEVTVPSQRSSKSSANEDDRAPSSPPTKNSVAAKPHPIVINALNSITVKGDSDKAAGTSGSPQLQPLKKKPTLKNASSTMALETSTEKPTSSTTRSTPELSLQIPDRPALKRFGWGNDNADTEQIQGASSHDINELFKTTPSPKSPEVKSPNSPFPLKDSNFSLTPARKSEELLNSDNSKPQERKKLAQNPLNVNSLNPPQLPNKNPAPAENAVAKLAALPSVSTRSFFDRLPEDGVLRCRIYRKKNLLDKANPTYLMHNDTDDKFMLAAKKKLMSKSIHYMISDSESDISKDSLHSMAKLKANYKRTTFILTDTRNSREIVCINYTRNVLPRELQVAVTSPDIDEKDAAKDIVDEFRLRTGKLFYLKNKPPRWNEATQSHCLNFGGRVTQPSIKNMQLIPENDENTIILQFGRCGPDLFSLDARWPLTPIEAFGIALSTFDAYDSS